MPVEAFSWKFLTKLQMVMVHHSVENFKENAVPNANSLNVSLMCCMLYEVIFLISDFFLGMDLWLRWSTTEGHPNYRN